MTIEEFQYPIGRFEKPVAITKEQITHWIAAIFGLSRAINYCS
jgi:hypothetical protein